jgi:hypothetical protein
MSIEKFTLGTKELILRADGSIKIPIEHINCKKITMPWHKEIRTKNSVTRYNRSKKCGDKPYIPEGFIEFDGVRYVVKEKESKP